MDKLIIQGGINLKGEVEISGSKNAALPIMAATLLTDESCTIENVPELSDTMTMIKLLEELGKKVSFKDNTLRISSNGKSTWIAPYKLVSTMRGSFCVLGPLVGKHRKAQVSLPGGCVIGIRPVDLHIKGLKLLGVEIDIENGYVIARAPNMKGAHIYLGGMFGSSVLATANIMMAASLAKGETIIDSAACEPEIDDLTNVLLQMGANIEGKGSPRLKISGVKHLRGFTYRVIPDRIEAGTYMMLSAATRCPIDIRGGRIEHLMAVVDVMREVGVSIEEKQNVLRVRPSKSLKPVSVTTLPYPGFPTDLQAQFMTVMALIKGVSVIKERVYPDRFMHIAELNRMGANIRREGTNALVQGVKKMFGAPVMASDLRASAALVIAALASEGQTEILRIYHLDRGYEKLDDKLKALGAKVERAKE